MKVPFNDLRRHHEPLRAELTAAFQAALDSSAFIGGAPVERFEKAFAATLAPSLDVVGVSSGTSALELVLEALGVGPGDEVITTSMTFFATTEAIVRRGAVPVYADIDARTWTLDPARVEALVTPRTKAIVPVHLYGLMADVARLRAIADRHGLALVEDAAQAHGARWAGAAPGVVGDAACFSFYPGKNLGALGDAGAVATRRPELAKTLRALRDHGRASKYEHSSVGTNARLDALQAALLAVKVPHLAGWVDARRQNANAILAQLGPHAARAQLVPPGADHAYHLLVLRSPARDKAMEMLKARGVECGIHYPIPCHLQPAMRGVPMRAEALPETERQAREAFSVALFPEMTPGEVAHVAGVLREVMDGLS